MKFLCRIIPAILLLLVLIPWVIVGTAVWTPVALILLSFMIMFKYGCNQKICWAYHIEKLLLPFLLAYAVFVDLIIMPIQESNRKPKTMKSDYEVESKIYQILTGEEK